MYLMQPDIFPWRSMHQNRFVAMSDHTFTSCSYASGHCRRPGLRGGIQAFPTSRDDRRLSGAQGACLRDACECTPRIPSAGLF